MLDFPNSPTVGQTYVAADSSWMWDGVKWEAFPTGGRAFDDFPGVVGDGVHDDTVGMQAAIDATIDPIRGGTIYGTPGRNYLITASLYLPSKTRCIGQGAQISVPVVPVDPIPGMLVIGIKGSTNGIPAGDELKSIEVEISGWRFFSPTGGKCPAGIIAQPGSERIMIRHNHFESDYFMYLGSLVPPTFIGMYFNKKRLRDIVVDSNTFYKVGRLILTRGSETQTGTTYYYAVLGSTNVIEVIPGDFSTAAPGTTYFVVPNTPASGETISPLTRIKPPYNWSWGVTTNHVGHPFDGRRLYRPADGGNDVSFDNIDRITLGAHIPSFPSATDYYTRFFVWNPDIEPGNDINGLTITNNRGSHTPAGTVALYCQIYAGTKGLVPEADGLRNVIIDNNRFEHTYLPGGNISSFATGSGDEDPALTNFALWTEDFSNAAWTKTGLTYTPGYWGPRYDTSRPVASRLIESAIAGAHGVSQDMTLTNAVSPWTASIFLQAPMSRSTARLTWTTAAGVGGYVDVDLVTGAIVGSGAVGGGAVNFSGVIPYGDHWFRVYIDCNILSTTGRFTLALTNGTGVTSYTGVTTNYIHAFGLQVEQQVPIGSIYFFRNNTPSAYKPTQSQAAQEISSAVISINGVVGFACTNNVISASCGQGIHVEDQSSNGVIAHNTISECTFGINIMNCHNVSVIENAISRFYKTGITVRGNDPLPPNHSSAQWVDFLGSISGTVLTVTSITNYPTCNLLPDSSGNYKTLSSPGFYTGEVRPQTRILNQLTGTAGSTGTYTVSRTQTVTLPTPPPMNHTILSAGFGMQADNTVLRGNTLDASGFPSVQAGYWIEACYDPYTLAFDNPPTAGLVTAPGTAALDIYQGGAFNFPPKLSGDSFPRPFAVADLGTPTAAKAGQRRLVNDAATPTYRGTIAGGGANVVWVVCTGTAWVAE